MVLKDRPHSRLNLYTSTFPAPQTPSRRSVALMMVLQKPTSSSRLRLDGQERREITHLRDPRHP